MSKSKIEMAYDQQRSAKYGVEKLEVEHVRSTVELIDSGKPILPNKHETQFRRDIKAKFGVEKLSFEGALGGRLAERTLEDATREHAKEQSKGMKLATAKVTYQNRPVRIWFEVSR